MSKNSKTLIAISTGAVVAIIIGLLIMLLSFQDAFGQGTGIILGPRDHNTFGKHLETLSLVGITIIEVADVPQDVWGSGGIIDWTQTGIVSIVSDSVEDNVSGTGASTVLVFGYDAAETIQQFETVTLTGTTPALTLKQYSSPLAVLRIQTVGSGGDEFAKPAGAGIITATINGVPVGTIRTDLDHNQSHIAAAKILPPPDTDGGSFTAILQLIGLQVGQGILGVPGELRCRILTKAPGGTWHEGTMELDVGTDKDETRSTEFVTNMVVREGGFIRAVVQADQLVGVSVQFTGPSYSRLPRFN